MPKHYSELMDLLNTAKGDRTLNQFAADCGIDAGHMSRITRGKMVNPPNPETLKKIAESACNGITYELLMVAAGHLERQVNGKILALLRGDRTYEEYCGFLRERGCTQITPQLLERYEEDHGRLDMAILEYICNAEGLDLEHFYQPNNNTAAAAEKKDEPIPDDLLDFMEGDIREWVSNPDNYRYIEFVYSACKAGITRELLDKAEISIRIR